MKKIINLKLFDRSWDFFGKDNKIDLVLASLTTKEKDNTQISKIRNNKGIYLDMMENF